MVRPPAPLPGAGGRRETQRRLGAARLRDPADRLEAILARRPIRLHPDAPNNYNPIYEDDYVEFGIRAMEIAATPPVMVNWAGSETVGIEVHCTYLGELVGGGRQTPRAGASVRQLPGTPSDDVPGVLATGRGDVGTLFVSMARRHPEGRDAEYLRWHTLDHRPEQHRLSAVRASQRAFLLIERESSSPEALLDVDGVAGVRSSTALDVGPELASARAGQHLTYGFLDDDPVATAHRLRPALARRNTQPLFAAPFHPVVPHQWDLHVP